MDTLGKILGSPARVKVMRLFLLNQKKRFNALEVSSRSRINRSVARRELVMLTSVDFLKKFPLGWSFNPAFEYGTEMERLLVNSDSIDKEEIVDAFKKCGRVKLIVISGIFIKDKTSRVDLLLVGDFLKKAKIQEAIRKFESEIGAELSYAFFESKEFAYRLKMYDKLVRDILDFPHEILLQSKELSTQALKKV